MTDSSPQDENNEPAKNNAERQQNPPSSETPAPATDAVDSGAPAAGEREPAESDFGPEDAEDAEEEVEERSVYAAQAALDYLLVAFGAVFVPFLLFLVADQSHVAFVVDNVAPNVRSEAKGNIGTLTIALAAVLGVLDWTYTNRNK